MIALCSSEQIRKWDAYTIAKLPISDFLLMEQASRAFVRAFCKRYTPEVPIYVLAGRGNNGGDGLCVARFLKEKGYTVKVYLWGEKVSSLSCQKALQAWQQIEGKLTCLRQIEELTESELCRENSEGVWIDALFGTGLSRPLEGTAKVLVKKLNSLPLKCVALDTPSGLLLDAPQGQHTAVEADHTISLQAPKRAFLLPENATYVGNWETVNIGLKEDFLQTITPEHGYLIEDTDVGSWLPSRPLHLHKGQAGRCLLVAGSQGMFGAALLAAKAAVRSGAGVLYVHLPYTAASLLHASLPEALLQTDPHPLYVSEIEVPTKVQMIAVGPGLSQKLPTAAALRKLLRTTKIPFVLDADALNLMAMHPELRDELPTESLLTPHEGELRRLIGNWRDDYDKLHKLSRLSKSTRSTVLLKGAYTVIASPDEPLYFNPTGNPGMATAGSGDVLTGLLLALRAAGLPAHRAAIVGAFLHGKAGDLAAIKKGSYGLIASDIIDQLPAAFLSVQNK